jgi:hypothetical protein
MAIKNEITLKMRWHLKNETALKNEMALKKRRHLKMR